jgi:membrane-bound lytic murein transglycosylase B
MSTATHDDDEPRRRQTAADCSCARSRRLLWRAMLSALAGGGLTAAGLGASLPSALAAEAQTSTTSTDPTPPPVTTTTPAAGEASTEAANTTTTATTPPAPTPSPSAQTTSTQPTTPQSTTPSAPTGTSTERTPTTNASPQTEAPPTVRLRRKQTPSAHSPAAASSGANKSTSTTKNAAGEKSAAEKAAANGANNVALPPQLVAAQAKALAAALASSAASTQALDFYRIPLFLLPIYRASAAQYGVPWQVLAAINEVETDYGTDQSVSSAGAVGWMQFMPSTWLEYGVDALNAGYADPYNPVDAIFAAGRYLQAAGAASSLNTAILAYNHSEAYVSSVLLRAKLIAAYPSEVIATLTGLVNDRPPVIGGSLSWSTPAPAPSANLPSPSSATAGATPSASSGAGTPGSEPAPTPASAASAASPGDSAPTYADLSSAPHAKVVAVQDGRVIKLGRSRKLGLYVELEDVYGNVFTYSGLGSLAHSYEPTKPELAADALARRTYAPPQGAGGRSKAPVATVTGKVRMFAHPGNPDAVLARARRGAGSGHGDRRPLQSGSLVPEGTVLGTVHTSVGARQGRMRFAVKPAGDSGAIDPSAILQSWSQLNTALHPQGARGSESLLGASASDVFLLTKSQLEREVLFDPGVAMSACSRQAVASGKIDKRALAVLAFLSRSGLKPTVGTIACGGSAYAASGYVDPGHDGDALALVAINGIPVAGHQGAGSITDTTIRTLLSLQGEYFPAAIVSLMRYPGAPTTLARADHGDYIEVVFTPAAHRASAAAAHAGGGAPSGGAALGGLSASQWEQLVARVAALPVPTVRAKPSSAAIPDPKRIGGGAGSGSQR